MIPPFQDFHMYRKKSQKDQYICLSYILAFQNRYLIVESIVLYQRNFCKPHFTVISTAFQEPFSLQKEHEIDTIKRLYFQTMPPLGATV